MDKPLCRICNHRHGAGEPHVWKDAVRPTNRPNSKAKRPVSTTNKTCSRCDELESKLAERDAEIERLKEKTKPKRDPDKYRAYQREYMRRYRNG